MKRENRNLRDPKFTKIAEQNAMELILQYVWAPIVLALLAIWRMLHRHEKEIEQCSDAHVRTEIGLKEAKEGRKEIYDKIETVRSDLTAQHSSLRADQREDFKEIRDLISNMSK